MTGLRIDRTGRKGKGRSMMFIFIIETPLDIANKEIAILNKEIAILNNEIAILNIEIAILNKASVT